MVTSNYQQKVDREQTDSPGVKYILVGLGGQATNQNQLHTLYYTTNRISIGPRNMPKALSSRYPAPGLIEFRFTGGRTVGEGGLPDRWGFS